MILILTSTVVMVVVNTFISKKNAPTMKAMIKQISKVKEGEKPRRHMIMRYPPLALLMMKKQTYAYKH